MTATLEETISTPTTASPSRRDCARNNETIAVVYITVSYSNDDNDIRDITFWKGVIYNKRATNKIRTNTTYITFRFIFLTLSLS